MKNYTFIGKDLPVRTLAKSIKDLEEKQGHPVRLTGKYILTEEGIKFEISQDIPFADAYKRKDLLEMSRKELIKVILSMEETRSSLLEEHTESHNKLLGLPDMKALTENLSKKLKDEGRDYFTFGELREERIKLLTGEK